MSKPPSIKTELKSLFVTEIYRAQLTTDADLDFIEQLDDACRAHADDDELGQDWCVQKGYQGYTSYGSIPDLIKRDSLFDALRRRLDPHVNAFAKALEFDLQGKKLRLDTIWINILDPGGSHSNHIHPHSVISGTFYVHVPEGSSALRFEDPRLDRFMAAPPRHKDAHPTRQSFVSETADKGTLLLWESWLRHEVPPNFSDDVRISISFNYAW